MSFGIHVSLFLSNKRGKRKYLWKGLLLKRCNPPFFRSKYIFITCAFCSGSREKGSDRNLRFVPSKTRDETGIDSAFSLFSFIHHVMASFQYWTSSSHPFSHMDTAPAGWSMIEKPFSNRFRRAQLDSPSIGPQFLGAGSYTRNWNTITKFEKYELNGISYCAFLIPRHPPKENKKKWRRSQRSLTTVLNRSS